MKNITPFSYIQDHEGNIYTVRVADNENGKFLSKVSYRCEEGNYIKQREFNLNEISNDIKWLSTHNVYRSWLPLPIGKDLVREHVLLSKIYNESIKTNSKLYLIGSRLLGIEKKSSDWDILVECSLHPLQVFNHFIENIPQVRKYNERELLERAKRYSKPNSYFEEEELVKIIRQCCTYAKYKNMDIGFFFIKSFTNKWFESKLFVTSLRNLILLPDKTDSYSMPKSISLKQENGNEITILLIDWLLYGIETIENQKLNFFNLWQINNDLFVLDYQTGYVELN